MKRIELKFNSSISSLCGNPFGEEVFLNQVLPFFDNKEEIIIVIPDYVDSVSMSFAQGFISAVAEKYGIERFEELIKIEAKNQRVLSKFNDAIALREIKYDN